MSEPQSVYLVELVSRMVAPDVSPAPGQPFVSSRDSVSWSAHREAETLADGALARAAMTLVESERKKDRRRALYFIIGKIGLASGDAACAEFLNGRLPAETDKYVLHDILERLAELPKPTGFDVRPIASALGDERWLVRHSAISALTLCANPDAERLLLSVLEGSTDPHDLTRANAALGSSGSARSIPALEKMAVHTKQDVACSALAALTRLGSAAQLPFFVERLQRGRATSYAMAAIEQHGDASAAPAVLARLRKLLGRKRAREELPRSELVMGVTFLWRFRDTDPMIATFLDETLPTRDDRLFEREREQIAALRVQGSSTTTGISRSVQD